MLPFSISADKIFFLQIGNLISNNFVSFTNIVPRGMCEYKNLLKYHFAGLNSTINLKYPDKEDWPAFKVMRGAHFLDSLFSLVAKSPEEAFLFLKQPQLRPKRFSRLHSSCIP